MNDDQLIGYVAQIWVDNGGDAEGIDWCYRQIKERVAELEVAKKEGNQHLEEPND